MPAGDLEIDAPALRNVGKDVTGAATTLRDAVKAAGTDLKPGQGTASTAGAAAAEAETAWLTMLRRITGEVDTFGTGLTTAANDYEDADETNAQDLRSTTGAGR
ncbi:MULTISPECIES: type VII secretion target [Actinoplanes]|uniref:type VII secretion target n=1 Tax=Actinoplanes TaxID=1865 RepID=UPI0007C6C3BE|nr:MULTISPECIES: type VII secretion target [Actinoplanes]GLY00651.1 hypothetical protein Acsp01_10300 [Actinoplanes sp. NBRC 101535]